MATDNSAEKQNIVVYNYSSSDENVQRMSSCLFSILLSGGLAVIVGMFLCSDLTHHESERYDTKFYAGVGLIIYGKLSNISSIYLKTFVRFYLANLTHLTLKKV